MYTLNKILILTTGAGILLIIYIGWKRNRENFKVVGNMGPFKNIYYKCSSACERSDPGKQLSPTHGNMMCQEYCDSVITDIARRGGPSYPSDYYSKDDTIKTPIDISYEICGDGEQNKWCRDKFVTASEIDSKCRQNCEYSTYPVEQCMDLCTKSNKGNYSRGWTWK